MHYKQIRNHYCKVACFLSLFQFGADLEYLLDFAINDGCRLSLTDFCMVGKF